MNCNTPGFPVPHLSPSLSLPRLMSIESVMLSNHLVLCCPFLLLSSVFPSIRIFSYDMSRLFTSGSQSIGASASASVLPMSTQGWFPLGLTGLMSLLSKELSRVFSNTTVRKHQFFGAQPSLWSSSRCGPRCIRNHSWRLQIPLPGSTTVIRSFSPGWDLGELYSFWGLVFSPREEDSRFINDDNEPTAGTLSGQRQLRVGVPLILIYMRKPRPQVEWLA